MNEQRYIYLDGKPIPVSEEVYLAWYRPVWKVHTDASRAGQCGQSNWKRCCGDCGICSFRLAGNTLSLDFWADECDYEPQSTSSAEDIVLDSLLLEELLQELDRIDPDGRRIGEALLDGLTDREAARELDMPVTTYSSKKLKLRKALKKRREKFF